MVNERNTENLVREILRKQDYYKDENIIVEEQKSKSLIVNKLLKNASKKGEGIGKPEFIIRHNNYPKIISIIECKADISKHVSKKEDKPIDYAVDGALLYAEYLKKGFEAVVAIGVSGENIEELKISNYLITKKIQLNGKKKKYCLLKNMRKK